MFLSPTPVHPRVCGEQRRYSRGIQARGGSSPRVRGTGNPTSLTKLLSRFIPACAGNSPPVRSRLSVAPVHPRVCGEQKSAMIDSGLSGGSSPRVRGTVSDGARARCLSRFIPACAGNRSRRTTSVWSPTVHPRVCGEQSRPQLVRTQQSGSSPRVRGTDPFAVANNLRDRFIPACAGNSQRNSARCAAGPVHPRVCGEQYSQPGLRPAYYGSSPRVRGTD